MVVNYWRSIPLHLAEERDTFQRSTPLVNHVMNVVNHVGAIYRIKEQLPQEGKKCGFETWSRHIVPPTKVVANPG